MVRSCKSYLWDHLREHHACRVALIFPVFFSWRLRESSFILFPENLNVSSAPGLEVAIGNLVSRVLSLSLPALFTFCLLCVDKGTFSTWLTPAVKSSWILVPGESLSSLGVISKEILAFEIYKNFRVAKALTSPYIVCKCVVQKK